MSPRTGAQTALTVTMDDVAAEAGVSRTAVSRVLLGQKKVSDHTRRKVRAAAEKLGYVPNVMARELASRTSNTVGLLLRDAANPAYGLLFTELQHAAHAVGMSVVSMTISVDQDGQQQVASLYRLLGMRVAGLIVATGGIRSEQLDPFRSYLPIIRAGRPETTDRIHAVSYDEEDAGRQLAQHILDHGHRKVAVLSTTPGESYPEWVRATSMAAQLRRRGAHVRQIPVRGLSDGHTQAIDLVRTGGVTAIMCPSDLRQLEMLKALTATGLSVPDDVSVSGCDGVLPGTDLLGLSTLRLPVSELAQCTINSLARLLVDPSLPITQTQLRGHLVPGRTTGPAPTHALARDHGD